MLVCPTCSSSDLLLVAPPEGPRKNRGQHKGVNAPSPGARLLGDSGGATRTTALRKQRLKPL
eukprot:3819964-Alexandrium_andersonii.AAC.1